MNQLPNDPMICLSVVNTKLRDCYSSLDALCEDLNIYKEILIDKLEETGYEYDAEQNQFV